MYTQILEARMHGPHLIGVIIVGLVIAALVKYVFFR
jgi:hypothetical protein